MTLIHLLLLSMIEQSYVPQLSLILQTYPDTTCRLRTTNLCTPPLTISTIPPPVPSLLTLQSKKNLGHLVQITQDNLTFLKMDNLTPGKVGRLTPICRG